MSVGIWSSGGTRPAPEESNGNAASSDTDASLDSAACRGQCPSAVPGHTVIGACPLASVVTVNGDPSGEPSESSCG